MLTHAERMQRFDASDLYVVITEEFCAGRNCLEVLDAVLHAGVTLIQYREKDWDDLKLFTIGEEFRRKTEAADALLIVNNRIDLALGIEADGVHLGQSDMPIHAARSVAPSLIIGASTHSLDDAETARKEGASYYNIGPIFATNTKELAMEALGPEAIESIAPGIDLPFTCMGGIKPDNIHEVLSRGAKHPAVVTAVTQQDDITAAARGLREQIRNP